VIRDSGAAAQVGALDAGAVDPVAGDGEIQVGVEQRAILQGRVGLGITPAVGLLVQKRRGVAGESGLLQKEVGEPDGDLVERSFDVVGGPLVGGVDHPAFGPGTARFRGVAGDPGQGTVVDEGAVDVERQRLGEREHGRPGRRHRDVFDPLP